MTTLCVAVDSNGNVLASTTPATASPAAWTASAVDSAGGSRRLEPQ